MLNATDGTIIEIKKQLPSFQRMLEVPGSSGPVTFRVLPDGTPQVAEDFNVFAPVDGSYIVTIGDNGQAMGWTIGQSARRLWTLRPSPGFKLINAVGRASHDPVASIGTVLGDRSVLYKYLSPNLVLLTALSSSPLLSIKSSRETIPCSVPEASSWQPLKVGVTPPARFTSTPMKSAELLS